MRERDIWLSAGVMMKRYGADAAMEAALRADALLANGDVAGQRVWLRITRAIQALEATDPAGPVN